jgi:hypothetical protein
LEVNKKRVGNIREFVEALSESEESSSALFLLQMGQQARYVILPIG